MTPEPAAARELVLTRTLDAPRALVFEVWTDPKHLAQWWGPHGFTGGKLYIEMRWPDGPSHPMYGEFVEVVKPERLAFTSMLKDDAGTVYLQLLNTVTFAEDGDKTILTVSARVVTAGPGSEEPLSGMDEGWNQSLERLAAYAARLA
jgi:uncharacterized protein YndB with AHSA1/START domain